MTSAGRGRGRATIVDVARAAGGLPPDREQRRQQPRSASPPTPSSGCRRRSSASASAPACAAQSLKQERAGALGIELNSSGSGRLGQHPRQLPRRADGSPRASGTRTWCPSPRRTRPRRSRPTSDLVASDLVDGFVLTDTRRDDPRPGWLRRPRRAVRRVRPRLGRPELHLVGRRGRPRRRDRRRSGTCSGAGYDRIGFLGWPPGSPVGDERRGRLAAARRPTPGVDAPRVAGQRPAGRRPGRRGRRHPSSTRWARRRGRVRLGHARHGRLDGPARARAGAGARLRHRRLRRHATSPQAFELTSLRQPLARGRRAGAGTSSTRPRRPADARGGAHPPTHARHRGAPTVPPHRSAARTWHHADNRTDNGGNDDITTRTAQVRGARTGRRRSAGALGVRRWRRIQQPEHGHAEAAGPANLKIMIGSSGDAETTAVKAAADAWAKKSGNTVEVIAASDLGPAARPGLRRRHPAGRLLHRRLALRRLRQGGQPLRLRRPGQGRRLPARAGADLHLRRQALLRAEGLLHPGPRHQHRPVDQGRPDRRRHPQGLGRPGGGRQEADPGKVTGLVIGNDIDRIGAFMVQAGGWVVSKDGKTVTADTPQNLAGLAEVTEDDEGRRR